MHVMALHIIKMSKFKQFVLKRFKMKLMAFIERFLYAQKKQ